MLVCASADRGFSGARPSRGEARTVYLTNRIRFVDINFRIECLALDPRHWPKRAVTAMAEAGERAGLAGQSGSAETASACRPSSLARARHMLTWPAQRGPRAEALVGGTQSSKGAGWMPWRRGPMKDVATLR